MNLQELARQEGDADAIAEAAVRSMDERQVRSLLVTLLSGAIGRIRRDMARMVEDEASSGSGAHFRRALHRIVENNEERKAKVWAERTRIQEAVTAGSLDFEDAIRQVYQLGVEGLMIYKTVRVEVDPGEPPEQNLYSNVQAEVRRGEYGFDPEPEIDRVRRIVSARERALARTADEERTNRDVRESEGMIRVGNWSDDLRYVFDRIKHHARLELTRELLDSTFSVGAGRTVSWGDATVEDHAARIDAQIKHAAGTLEDAERHRVAMAMLVQSSKRCLNEIAEQEAVAA